MNLAASTTASGGPAWWITIFVAGIAAFASVLAAVVASLSARSTKQLEVRSQHARELEDRISEAKFNTYKPIIEMLGAILNSFSNNDSTARLSVDPKIATDFGTWVAIYGSDGALIAYHNFLQATWNGAPALVKARLYTEFIIAARRDIGYPETRITAAHLMGIRVSDLYSAEDYHFAMTSPFAELCQRMNWTPPWTSSQKTQRVSPTNPAPSS